MEFLDGSTLVSASDDGSIKVWDVASGTPKDTVAGEKFALCKKTGAKEQRAGRFLVTWEGDMVLVHHADGGEASDGKRAPVAFFRAPSPVQTISCAEDKIGVGCQSGAVLHLRAPWLVEA